MQRPPDGPPPPPTTNARPFPHTKVNHKCVPKDDPATSSYAKARALFLDAVGAPGCAVPPSGTESAEVGGGGAAGAGLF